jgi:hypothetical protein
MAKPTLQLPGSKSPAATVDDPIRDPAPSLGLPVIVKTSEKISGQDEHAAIITQVHSDDVVNVMVFPGTGQPYPIASIARIKHSVTGSLSWRWPSR